ncbi:FUSC family protein [Actinomadura sp. NPDC049753]|uniref:FUSC family protein n=1 Tax=Actinomadura sp. NPDC049753 TaxID=3154739 RepID=UPI00341DCFD2
MPDVLTELLTLHPSPPRHRSAVIAAACTAAPVLIGGTLHQPGLGLGASTGALAALYGGRGAPLRDAAAVGGAGLALTAGMALGGTLAGQAWGAVLGTAMWTCLVSAIFSVANARPPGIVMPVLVCAAGAGLPPGHAVQRAAAVAAVAACATVLTWGAARPRRAVSGTGLAIRRTDVRRLAAELPASPVPWAATRAATAVALAGSFSLLCQLGRPSWAMAAAGAVLGRGGHAASANARARLRGAGTAVGCVLAGALAALEPRGIMLAALLASLTYITELVVIRNYALAMVFVTPLGVLLATSAAPASAVTGTTVDRLLETVSGCLAAVVAGQMVTRRWAVVQRRRAIAAVLERTAELLEHPQAGAAPVHRARGRLALVSERTAGERRGVRAAAAALDPVAAAAEELAERATNGALAEAGDETVPVALRHFARLVRDGRPRPSRSFPAPLTELATGLNAWLTADIADRARHGGACAVAARASSATHNTFPPRQESIMTSTVLPVTVQNAVDAANAGDTDAFLACFSPDGAVDDWGRLFRGHQAIRRWSDAEFIGVSVRLTVTGVRRSGDTVTVSAEVGGDGFNGPSHFAFTLTGERVALMRITA